MRVLYFVPKPAHELQEEDWYLSKYNDMLEKIIKAILRDLMKIPLTNVFL